MNPAEQPVWQPANVANDGEIRGVERAIIGLTLRNRVMPNDVVSVYFIEFDAVVVAEIRAQIRCRFGAGALREVQPNESVADYHIAAMGGIPPRRGGPEDDLRSTIA